MVETIQAPKLTPKKAKFAREYLIDFNKTQAAIRAGYSKNHAGQAGYDLFKKPEIQAEIARLRTEQDAQFEFKVAKKYEVLAKVTEIMRGDIGKLLLPGDELENLSLQRAKELGMSALIKEIKTYSVIRQVPHEKYNKKTGKTEVVMIDEQTVTTEVKLHSSHEAARDLMKHLGLLAEKMDITSDGKPIAIIGMPLDDFK